MTLVGVNAASVMAKTEHVNMLWFLMLVQVSLSTGFCPDQCNCNDQALSVSCTNSGLEVLPITLNPSIRRLHLQHNTIKAVDAAMGFYGQLVFVDLAHNDLFSIPDKGFNSQRKLVELKLGNNKISQINNNTFHGLSSLTVLSLRRNFLEQLDDNLFVHAPLIEELDVGQNRISFIAPGAFNRMERLRVLWLDDNDLHSVPTQVFSPISHLAELNLGANPFEHVTDGAFASITNLYRLNLDGGSVRNLTFDAFRGLETLRVLWLSGNALDAVPSRQLSVLERLEELRLGANYFEVLPADSLPGLKQLKELDLSGSRNLATISAEALSQNPGLAKLSLAGCKQLDWRNVPLGRLAEGLKSLDMTDLGLSSLPGRLSGALSGLESIHLGQNRLACDCRLDWLRQILVRLNATGEAVCAAPAKFSGQYLVHVPPMDAAKCHDLSSSVKTILVEASGGDNAADESNISDSWLDGEFEIDDGVDTETAYADMSAGVVATMSGGDHAVIAGVCVTGGLLTGIAVLLTVHCHRRRAWRLEGGHIVGGEEEGGSSRGDGDRSSSGCRTCVTSQYNNTEDEPQVETLDGIYHANIPNIQNIELFYPSNTKSTFCDDDYFLSLSKDRKTFKPIRVCEL